MSSLKRPDFKNNYSITNWYWFQKNGGIKWNENPLNNPNRRRIVYAVTRINDSQLPASREEIIREAKSLHLEDKDIPWLIEHWEDRFPTSEEAFQIAKERILKEIKSR